MDGVLKNEAYDQTRGRTNVSIPRNLQDFKEICGKVRLNVFKTSSRRLQHGQK